MADTEFTASKTETPIRKIEKIAEKATAQVAASVEETKTVAATGLKDVQAKVTEGLHKAAEAARGYADVQRGALETVVKAGQTRWRICVRSPPRSRCAKPLPCRPLSRATR